MSESIVVQVKPGSRKGPLVEVGQAVTKLLATHLGVPRSRLELMSGATARVKRFRIS